MIYDQRSRNVKSYMTARIAQYRIRTHYSTISLFFIFIRHRGSNDSGQTDIQTWLLVKCGTAECGK